MLGVRHVEIFDTERNNLGEIRSSKVNSPTSAKFVWNRKYTIDTVYHLSSNDREVRSDRDIANALGGNFLIIRHVFLEKQYIVFASDKVRSGT